LQLSKTFPKVDFSHVDPVYPDKTSPAGSRYAYTRNAILARAQSCLRDLYNRPEKFIIIVSHSCFLRLAVTGCWFFNGDYRIFDFEEREGPDDEYRLKQWEQTSDGGMGWSWSKKVDIGSELPDEDGQEQLGTEDRSSAGGGEDL
jgi:hypothetical protein